MHPAASVILFTTSTGFGYGLLYWLSITLNLSKTGQLPTPYILTLITIALLLITFGLLASLWHLGHPERAWRALSQWRTSWLSREGVFAVLVYPPALLMGLASYLQWTEFLPLLSILVAALSLITIYCTAMIYASLKTIPAWCNSWTISGYILYSLLTGGVLCYFLAMLLYPESFPSGSPQLYLLIGFILLALSNKIIYWKYIQRTSNSTTKETAIGIKGNISPLDPPHSSANYLMKEMGFQIARKQAHILTPIAVLATYIIPCICLLIASFSSLQVMIILLSTIALVSCVIGIIAERYLFFAEAKHVVTLYY
jgi:DMSO reductase anchor subunit